MERYKDIDEKIKLGYDYVRKHESVKASDVWLDLSSMSRRFTMRYTKEERLDIGRQIYERGSSRYEIAEQYGISESSARK